MLKKKPRKPRSRLTMIMSDLYKLHDSFKYYGFRRCCVMNKKNLGYLYLIKTQCYCLFSM